MKDKSNKLIKSMLGEDFFEVLSKSDVYKESSRTGTNVEDMKIGLNIVPRTVMSYLISNLSDMQFDENKELELPFGSQCTMHIVKKDYDSFSGYLYADGKKINEFLHRSIPALGLVLMTVLELYDIDNLKQDREEEKETFDVSKLQNIIDERLSLHSLIGRVVDQKIAQRDAIETLIKERLSHALSTESETEEVKEDTKSDKLKTYLEQQDKRLDEAQFEKSEKFYCHDCGTDIYNGGKSLTLCICYGEDWNKDIKITKSESGIKMKFPKSMDTENIQMLLTTLRQTNKE